MDTRAVRAGREDLPHIGVHAPPIDLSTTYPVTDLDTATASLEALVAGDDPPGSPIYARLHNPTVARCERAVADLEGAEAAVAFASGMAAMTACLLAAQSARGGHVVALRPLYGGTDQLLATGMLGTEVTWATADQVGAAIRPDTGLVVMETPANPTLDLIDIEAVVRQATPVPVLVDSTFATPILQQPLRHGAALVLHSATKYLAGHGDVLGGVVACGIDWARRLRSVRIATGAVLHPLAAYLLHRGLPTLPLRVRTAQAHAEHLAERLAQHPAVSEVHYPGQPGADPLGLLGRQLRGPGSVIAFRVRGGRRAAAAVMSGVRVATPAVSLGSVDTLIQHPAGLTHHGVAPTVRDAEGVPDDLLRLAVGLEDPDDLWWDLEAALSAAVPEVVSV